MSDAQADNSAPTVAIVTSAKATFFKPLYESFAKAQPLPWKTLIVWPEGLSSEHPPESVTPQAPNLEVILVPCGEVQRRDGAKNPDGHREIRQRFLPSRALWRLLASRNVRAILIHEFSPYTIQALFFAKWRRIPLVVSSELGKRNRNLFSASARLWHSFWGRFADGIVACSPAAREPHSGGNRPTVATYHAVDSRLYLPLPRPGQPDSPVVFAYLGQLVHRKGIDLLLQAAARLRDEGVGGFRIRLIGGGDMDWVRDWITRLKLEEKVELTGFLSGDAIRAALGTADVFVLPTRSDTYAAVVHEAACMGLPLLVSLHAGAAEALVENGENGYISAPEKLPDFAAMMRKFLDRGLRMQMSARSRSTGERFSAHERGKAMWDWLEHSFNLTA